MCLLGRAAASCRGWSRAGVTVADAVAEWLRSAEHDRAVKPSTLTDYRHTGKRIARDRGEMRLEDVTTELLERWRATLTSSSRTVAKLLVILHGIFRRAMKVWGLASNLAATVERPRYRVSDDLDAFSPGGGLGAGARGRLRPGRRDVSDGWLHRPVYGGAARPAVARRQLQRRDDSRASQLQRPRRRRLAEERPGPVGGDGPRRRPASGCARRPRVLCRARGPGVRQRARHLPGCFLDPHPLPGRPLARAGLPQLRFDDLRHSFGTLAVRRAEVPAVQAWMAHSDIQTTMRHVHHRDRGDEARLLAEAFRPAGTFGDVSAETSQNVPR
jgi:integrase